MQIVFDVNRSQSITIRRRAYDIPLGGHDSVKKIMIETGLILCLSLNSNLSTE